MKKIHYILLSGLMAFSLVVKSQPYLDLGQVSFHTSPGGDPRTFQHLRAQVNIPIVFKDSSVFVVNPIWDERWLQISDASDYTHLRGFITWFTYSKPVAKNWSMMLAFIPRWQGELPIQFSQGFQAGGAILMSHHVYPTFTYKFGLYYNREFWGNFFMPLFGVDWLISKNQRLFGILPGYMTYENRIGKRFAWGGNFRTYTNSYKIATGTLENPPANFIRLDDNQLGAYADVYLLPKLVLTGEAGMSILRKIRSGYGHTSKGEYTELSNNSAPYFRITLQYRMRLD